jgi:ankyrin repeat protein
LLLSLGADPDLPSTVIEDSGVEFDGLTPLAAAAVDGSAVVLMALLDEASEVDTPITVVNPVTGTFEGVTPLALAAARGHADCVDTLLAAGADPDAAIERDLPPETLTPAGFARVHDGPEEILSLLSPPAE